MIKSKALEVNIARYQIDVVVDDKYKILQEVMSKYYGLLDRIDAFLKELSHPYKNWQFIVKEARRFSLEYFYLLKDHPIGDQAAQIYIDIFFGAIDQAAEMEIKADAADNLLLLIKKIISDSGPNISKFKPLIDGAFDRMCGYHDDIFSLFVQSYYQVNTIGKNYMASGDGYFSDYTSINMLMIKYGYHTYDYWLNEADPFTWLVNEARAIENVTALRDMFNHISHQQLQQWRDKLDNISQEKNIGSPTILKRLAKLPGYGFWVKKYREMPQRLYRQASDNKTGNQIRLLFLFLMMRIPGLSAAHEEVLRDINRTLSWLISHEEPKQDKELINKTFSILKERTVTYPETILNCILNMGDGVYKTDDSDLINYYIDQVIDMGFQLPMIEGVGNDWQIRVNSAHIQNIRTWLQIIRNKPQWSVRLISALTVYLSVGGVFIKDTDLFPRDITRFLNSELGPVYNQVKQLVRLFPAFFNDIGAEGKLRDTSTQLDEICRRKDVLVHFLRKQSHVESSNRTIGFMEAAIQFWHTKNKTRLQSYVPPEIYNQIDTDGPYIDGVHRVMSLLHTQGLSLPEDLLTINQNQLSNLLKDISGVSEKDVKRVSLAVMFYQLLNQKYNFDDVDLDRYILQFKTHAFPDLTMLKEALAEPDLKRKLYKLLTYLEHLKSLILSSRQFEIREDIYKKRHITVDIPSMYGSYRETKFDALGLSLRIESLVNVLFEEVVAGIDLSLITKATFFEIFELLMLFNKALKLDGISSREMGYQLDLLAHSIEIRGFSFTQYLDIFNGFARAVNNIINDYFHNIHEKNLTHILSKISNDQIQKKYLPETGHEDTEKLTYRILEIFFRDQIACSLGLQQLDLLLSRILNTLFRQSEKLPAKKLHALLNYDPKMVTTALDPAKSKRYDIIHLGNKGLNLIKLKSYGWSVPPGFIITTELFRSREIIDSYVPAEINFNRHINNQLSSLEKITGKTFGSPKNPLLLSVRSGSSISQPGMMDSFLNVGLNEDIVSKMAVDSGNAWFAWDNYRRFLQGYGMSFGLKRNDFDAVINDFKEKYGVAFKRQFAGEQMRDIALTYKGMIRDSGIVVNDSPFDQLVHTIKSVIRSWESERAKTYRRIIGISDDWGTAVTVQAMVFGNVSQQSGAGVIFTHSPKLPGDTIRLWGDFTIGNQGEDVVSGLVKTIAVSELQKEMEQRDAAETLESDFPEIYHALKKLAYELIYEKGWSPQEIEFTFESPSAKDLYLLQTRDMGMRQRKKQLRFDPADLASKEGYLGRGIGVSGGSMSGRIVFSLEGIEKWRRLEPDTLLILTRSDTVPDDIREIFAADGLLTARGGLTSHAAVVAHRLEKTCVVGCGNFICNEKEKTCLFNNTVRLKSGDFVSIDGQEGSVYQGQLKVKEI